VARHECTSPTSICRARRGRSLAALGDARTAARLHEARKVFSSLGYKPALAETEALLRESEAAAV
jgi:hypothetical protein